MSYDVLLGRSRSFVSLVSIALALTACAAEPELQAAEEALRVELTPHAIAYDFAQLDSLPHGIAGDEELVFVTQPLTGRVVALDRLSGRVRGELTPPSPEGFLLPFGVRVPESGHLVVLDAGGFPSASGFATPRIYDYAYDYDPLRRRLTATLTRSVRFDGIPVGFSEDIAVLDDGSIVLTDSVLGAIWVVGDDGVIRPGIVPASFAPTDAIPELAPCGLPAGIVVGGVPFATLGNFAPGVGSVAERDGYLYFSGTCSGGIWRVPTSVFDDARPPHERADDIVPISPRPAGVLAEALKGLAFDDSQPDDPRIYFLDGFSLRLLRADVETGEREVVADDPRLFQFGVAADFLPPIAGSLSPLVVSSDQEHLFSAINAAIPADAFELPFLITKVIVLD